jgi:hypothetical protein
VPEIWISADQEIRMQVTSISGYQEKLTLYPDNLMPITWQPDMLIAQIFSSL